MKSEVDYDGFRARLEILMGTEKPFAWAKQVGLDGGTFDRVWNKGTVPRAHHLIRIAEVENVSLDWLLRGEGPMRPGQAAATAVAEAPAAYDADDMPDGFVLLPRFEVRAGAGGGAVVHSEQIVDHLAFKRDWVVRQLRRNPANLILIEAMGDSMETTISDGDLLLVDRGEDRLRDNAIYALSLEGGVLVKRLQRRMNGNVVVISDNRDHYPPDELNAREADELRIIGQVVWHGGVL